MTKEQAAHREEISAQSYFRWRKEYGGLKVDQAKRLKEKENARLKRLVAEATRGVLGNIRSDNGSEFTAKAGVHG